MITCGMGVGGAGVSAPYDAKGHLFKRQTRARKSGTLWTCCATLDGITAQEVLVMDVM